MTSLEFSQLRLDEPRLLVVLLVVPLLLLAARRSLAELPLGLRVLSALLRVAFVALLTLAATRVTVSETSQRICATVALDVSQSVPSAGLSAARRYVAELFGARKTGDTLRVLVFAEGARAVELGPAGELPTDGELRARVGTDATDLERALRSSSALSPDGCLQRTILLSDGIQTRGDVLSAVADLAPTTRVSTVALRATLADDVAVLDVRLPEAVSVGEPFEAQIEVHATRAGPARFSFYQGPGSGRLEAERSVDLPRGTTFLSQKTVVRAAGSAEFRAVVESPGGDRFPRNDAQRARIDVPGAPRVLIVDSEPDQARYLADALGAQQFDVEVRSPAAFPASAGELGAFRFVVLSDVPRSAFDRGAERLLISWVRGGGGLLYAGGAASYGPGGWQGSELAKVLPVSMDDEKTRETPGVALALVIDRSGSMTGVPLELAKEACLSTLGVLDAHDLLEVIAFDAKPTRYVKMQPARYRSRIEPEILRIQPGGGTEIFPALDAAFQDLVGTEARKKHVILLTDGNASAEGISDLVANAFADGVGVTTVGLGPGVNEELLRSIAEGGGGRYHHAAEPSHLPRIFTRETELLTEQRELSDWYPMRAVAHPDFLAGVDFATAPFLRGFTRVQPKPAPAELILTTDGGQPLLARQRVGLGQTLAWTSDFKARWSIDLLRWRGLGKWLAQMVRAHQSQNDERRLPMTVHLTGDDLTVRVEAYDREQHFDNALVSALRIEGEDSPGVSVPFQLIAPGRYEARTKLGGFGSYALSAEHRRRLADGSLVAFATSRASVSRAYPDEFRRVEPDPELLARIADASGGRVEPTPTSSFEPGDDHLTKRTLRTEPLVLAALGAFVLDLAVRRLRFGWRRRAS